MLIDCIRRDFTDKTMWILLLVFLNILGAILYYFMIKRKDKKDALPRPTAKK
ncbi:PLDc_N domain-containing protein [bacterium]|nr:PLDc_N domain-containing protein [bacterium]NBX49040.1 PLDc_N domain-containing protein [bacterium]